MSKKTIVSPRATTADTDEGDNANQHLHGNWHTKYGDYY